ncbi:hypothetical protein FALBO_14917 [Fusarium albosuccineum]|uniref:Uncharacterized protein n=1 Tax=Fusarium albosuccineum TaxID=1237068 RepID=A0A8H4KZ82_9HYPO|nr:hypothetical protein FALBO_14917 [Fusarium albosuccineum]
MAISSSLANYKLIAANIFSPKTVRDSPVLADELLTSYLATPVRSPARIEFLMDTTMWAFTDAYGASVTPTILPARSDDRKQTLAVASAVIICLCFVALMGLGFIIYREHKKKYQLREIKTGTAPESV